MRDPHVETLFYEVSAGPGLCYREPPNLSFSTALGNFNVEANVLQVEPSEHFADEASARKVIEDYLRAWEVQADLVKNLGTIRFKFQRAHVVDRSPPEPDGKVALVARGGGYIVVGSSAVMILTMGRYPDPPRTFYATPDVQVAYRRWVAYREGKEPLPSMGYFVLTLLKEYAGGRSRAARLFNIHREILNTLARLTSTKGDASSARKASRGGKLVPLTSTESEWIEKAVRQLILRLGERASAAGLPQLRMEDLPPL